MSDQEKDKNAERIAADQKEQAARAEAEATHAAEQAAAKAQEDADRAQATADQLSESAENVADELEPTVTVDLGGRSFSKRLPGGGTRRYGPGKVKVPKSVADYIKSNPTFATSGNERADKDVRGHLERNFGIKETVGQDVVKASVDTRAAQGRPRGGSAEKPAAKGSGKK